MKKSKKRWTVVIVVVAILILAILGIILVSGSLAKNAFSYDEIEAKRGSLVKYVSATGNARAFDSEKVVATKDGTVDKTHFQVGDYVKKGQTIMVIDTKYYRSNISGYLSELHFREGQNVQQGATLFSITDYSTMDVLVTINESNYLAISVGDTAEIDFTAIADEVFSGKVESVSFDGTSSAGAVLFSVRISVDGEDEKMDLIRNNMSCEVKIEADRAENALLLPVKAISYDKDQPYVLVGKDGKVERKYVNLGISDGIIVEIVSGINEGEIISYMNMTTSRLEEMMGAMWG